MTEPKNIHLITNNHPFIQNISSYVQQKFTGKFDRLKILMPSGYLCIQLSQQLIAEQGTTILPAISSFGEINAESEEIFKIPSKNFGTLTPAQERMVLAEIIYEYPDFNYNLANSIRFAPSLSRLFYELEAAKISIEELKSIPDHGDSVHWQQIYSFLAHAYSKWHKAILNRHMVSRAANQIALYESELSRLKNNPDQFILFAGVVGTNKISRDFIGSVAALPNAHLIIPKIGTKIDHLDQALSPSDPLFLIKGVLQKLGTTLQFASKMHYADCLITAKDTSGSKGSDVSRPIDYIEFASIFDEAEYVATQITKLQHTHQNQKIAILCLDHNVSNLYQTALTKHSLTYDDLIGENITKNNAINLLLDVAAFASSDFSLDNFFKLISNPEILSPATINIKKQLLARNRFAASLDDVTATIDDEECLEWLHSFQQIMTKYHHTSSKFSSMLLKTVQITEKLVPSIWQKHAAYNIADSIKEIYSCNWQISLRNKSDFTKILREFIAGGRLFGENTNSNIIFTRIADVSLANFDHVFIVDFSESKYPKTAKENPWINKHLQEEFDLNFSSQNYGVQLFDFYQILQNPKVTITRSISQPAQKELQESSFMLKLMLLAKTNIRKYETEIQYPADKETSPLNQNAYSDRFPSRISATDIELLIRAPYNFYAKKILGLRKQEKLDDQPNLAEFGSFFHEVAEHYTNSYNSKKDYYAKLSKNGKIEAFTQSAEELLSNSPIPNSFKLIWRTKIFAIAPEFIDFEDQRQTESHTVLTEIRGQTDLFIAGRKVTISAIADRVEATTDGTILLVDYKTGTPPTKSDIFSGLSPQLIVEAIIAQAGGFPGILPTKKNSKMLYIKINSTEPYLKQIEYEITLEDLAMHKEGLEKLLGHYIKTGSYPVLPCIAKYDDYMHLARR